MFKILVLLIPILALLIPITVISPPVALIILAIISFVIYKMWIDSLKSKEKGTEVMKLQEQLNKMEVKLNEMDKEMDMMRESIIFYEDKFPLSRNKELGTEKTDVPLKHKFNKEAI